MVLEIIREARSLIAVLSATAKALRLAVLTKVRQYPAKGTALSLTTVYQD
jgi:hypothetical protein